MRYIGILIYVLIYATLTSLVLLLILPLQAVAGLNYIWLDRRYYRYKLTEYFKSFRYHSMINKGVLILYSVIIVVLGVFYVFNHSVIGTISSTAYCDILQRILGINSILVGVIISLLILTFRVLNENFGDFAFRAVFKSKYNRILISFFLFNFFLSSYTLMYLNQNEYSVYYETLFWITLGSNIFLLCTALPFAFLSLKSASQKSNFDAILESLDDRWIGMYITNRMNKGQIYRLQINPIKEITKIGRKLIESEDYESFRVLDEKFYDKLNSLGDSDFQFRRFFYQEYREFVNTLFSPSLKSEAAFFTTYLVHKRIELEKDILQLKVDKRQNPIWVSSHHDIQIDFSPFFYKTTVIKDEAYFEAVMSAYLRLGEFYIQEIAPTELPKFEKIGHQYMTVQMLFSSYLGTGISNIAERLREENHIRHFQYLFRIFSLQGTVIQSQNSRSTKIFLVHILETAKRDSFEFYLRSNPYKISYLSFPFNGFGLDYEIEVLDRTQILSGLLWACDLSIQFSQLSYMVLNRLNSTVFGLYRLKSEKGVDIAEPLDQCLDQFDKMRLNLSKTKSLHDMDMYLAIHSYLTTIKKGAGENNLLDKKLDKKLNSLFKKFKKLTTFKKALDSSHYIRDENIV